MKKIIEKIAIITLVIFASCTPVASATFSIAPALFDTSLASPQQTGDTTMTLVTAPNVYNADYICIAVDSGLTTLEYECGTASTTPNLSPQIVNLTRGLNFRDASTTVSANVFSHRSGADVRITTFPVLTLIANQLNGSATFPNILSYTSGTTIATSSLEIPYADWVNRFVQFWTGVASTSARSTILNGNNTYVGTQTFSANNINNGTPIFNGGSTFQTVAPNDSVAPTQPNNIANKSYVDGVAISGSPISSNTLKGIGYTASTTQLATGNGEATSTPYFIPVTLVASTATTTNAVVSTNSSGIIDSSLLPYYFGNGADGNVTISANSTTTLNRDMYYNNLTLNGTIVEDGYRIFVANSITGSGYLTWGIPPNGDNGANLVQGAGGQATTSTKGGIFRQNGAGGIGGAGSNGTGGSASTATSTFGASGGAGGEGGDSLNGVGATTTNPTIPFGVWAYNTFNNLDMSTSSNPTFVQMMGGMGGGGGGGGSGGNGGGGGGASCGPEFLSAKNWGGTFTIYCTGGNGGAGVTTDSGGGGGGSGGASVAIYGSKTWTGIYALSGGNGGTGGACTTGQSCPGNQGQSGYTYEIQIANMIR